MKKILIFTMIAAGAAAQSALPPELDGIGIDQQLGAQLPMNAMFTDEAGNAVRFGSFFHGRPVLLAMVYYECPMLCSQILNGVVSGLKPLSLRPGKDFDVVAVSINPSETPKEAADKRAFYTAKYAPGGSGAGWHFLVGKEADIKSLADAVGFHYRYDSRIKMFIHASGVMILTPDGKAARYLYGVAYEPKDLKLALVEASGGRIGSRVDQVLLFCYHYDPKTGKYGAVAINSLRAAALLVLIALAVSLTLLWRREIQEGRRVLREAPHT
jgi:protein SCO1/2